jgi:eukaryotic-like serine/threonine-protein kinase
MSVQHHACDPKLIDRLLSRELPSEEQAALESHLEVCSTCRETLDAMTADLSWWREARDFLSEIDHEPFHGHALENFLAPTDDPRMLGRVGPYEIAGIIGLGGMGIVLKGFDGALNRYVAIKLLAPRLAASATARRRFAREAQAAATVMHDNVMAIHAVAESQGLPYFVMPYARGASLEKRIQQSGPLGVEEILRVGLQVAAGLAAAHAQGLVHRDIKPANILLEEGTERVKITDFGLARAADDASLTRSGVIAGTPQYMSPEQARGEAIDHRADLFSLGSVLYAMATGRPPFRADTPYGVLRRICETEPRPVSEINPAVPAWLAGVIARLHDKDPARRFESAAEVAALLEQCLAHVQQPSSIPLPALLAEPARARRRWVISAASIGAALLVLVALMFAGRTRDGEREQSTADERRVGIAHHESTAGTARGKNGNQSHDAISSQIDRARESARRLESDVREPPTADDVIQRELDRVDRGLRSLEADVLESLGED